MTLTWISHPQGEARATLIWRGFVIVMAVLVHLLLASRAHADEMVMLKAASMGLDARGSVGAVAGVMTSGAMQMDSSLPVATNRERSRPTASRLVVLTTERAGHPGFAGNHFLDSEMQLEFSPSPTSGFYAGYRLVDLKLARSGVLLDTGVSGPLVGGFLRF